MLKRDGTESKTSGTGLSPFDIVKLLNEKGDSEVDLKDYNPWMINRVLSNHQQTVLFASAMNKYYWLDKDIQFKFYKEGIPKGKRFGQWQKKFEATDILVAICDKYGCSMGVAKQYEQLLSDNEKKHLLTCRGGK
jgi:hypothetical protein